MHSLSRTKSAFVLRQRQTKFVFACEQMSISGKQYCAAFLYSWKYPGSRWESGFLGALLSLLNAVPRAPSEGPPKCRQCPVPPPAFTWHHSEGARWPDCLSAAHVHHHYLGRLPFHCMIYVLAQWHFEARHCLVILKLHERYISLSSGFLNSGRCKLWYPCLPASSS